MNEIQIPQVVRDKILSVLHTNKQWVYYENRLKEYKKKNNIAGINKMQDILHKLEVDVIENYIKEYAEEQTTVGDLLSLMPQKDSQKIKESLYAIVFMCDMIDSNIKDIESTIQRVFPDGEVIFYNKLKILSAEVKVQIGAILDTANEKNTELFCKYSDKAQEYIMKQARYFLKTQEHAKAKAKWNELHPDKSARKVRQ